MTTMKRLSVGVFALLLWTDESVAIEACGFVPSGEVWTVADSPVVVTCDLNIAALSIEPGVAVLFAGNFQMVVSGTIRVLGNKESQITFGPAAGNTAGWGGFYFEDAIAGSEFRWSRIAGATSSGVHLVRSAPTFDYVTFTNNSAERGGGLRVALGDDDLHIHGCVFEGNHARIMGGAIYSVGSSGAEDASLVVTDSIFLSNTAGTTSTRDHTFGGAIYAKGNSRIHGSSFRRNEARAYTIYIRYGRYTRGGAIFINGKSEITATSFDKNGCRMSAHSQTPDASHAYGGAVYLHAGSLLLENSLLTRNFLSASRNRDYRGSALYVAGGEASILNSTLTNNTAHVALYRSGGNVTVRNSILFFNYGSGQQIAGAVEVTFSDVQHGHAGEGNIGFNPIFGDRYAILAPSPAVDAGDPGIEQDDIFPPGLGGTRNDMGYTGGPNASHWASSVCYRDVDQDGYGDSASFAYMQTCPQGFVDDDTDCDDSDPEIHPGVEETCENGSNVLGKCGFVPSGEVWTAADSPVMITCSLSIAELTIEPGVEVLLSGNHQIVVVGTIRSLGTQDAPIVFKPAAGNAAGWGGFYFEDAINGSAFRWAHIEGATSSGVHLVRSAPTFDYVRFTKNSAQRGGALRIALGDNDVQVRSCLFENNHASIEGGAIYAVGSSGAEATALLVTDSDFLSNTAGTTSTREHTFGGAIYTKGNSRIHGSSFRGNEARAYTIYIRYGRYTRGGAIFINGKSEITATSFDKNGCRMSAHSRTPDASRAHGGAVYLHAGSLLLENSLLTRNFLSASRNRDYRGSALYVAGGTASILNSTLANNTAHVALYRSGGHVTVRNSILFFNYSSGQQIAGAVEVTFSDVQNCHEGEGNICGNPIFDPEYAIVWPSPSIDTGDNSTEYDDVIPPGLGTGLNDMGYTGGPGGIRFGPRCGDGEEFPGEQCDDGGGDNADACLDTCMAASCGDGFVEAGVETCDDGNLGDDDSCSNVCSITNDECVGASLVTVDRVVSSFEVHTSSKSWNSLDPISECTDGPEGATAWFVLTPDETRDYAIELVEADYDGILSVWRMVDGCELIEEIGCDRDAGSNEPSVRLGLEEGETYLLRVGSRDLGKGGSSVLRVPEPDSRLLATAALLVIVSMTRVRARALTRRGSAPRRRERFGSGCA